MTLSGIGCQLLGYGSDVRSKGAGERFVVLEDAVAVAAQLGPARGAEQRTLETCVRLFRGRERVLLDELAETWWVGEHGEETAKGVRARRPYASLPVSERAALRAHVEHVRKTRATDALGDMAVLEAERTALLGLPARGLRQASRELYGLAEKDPRFRGVGVVAAAMLVAGDEAGIAHVGTCRVHRVRDRDVELVADANEQVVGMTDDLAVATVRVTCAPGDVFVLTTDRELSSMEALVAVRARGLDAAAYLARRRAVVVADVG